MIETQVLELLYLTDSALPIGATAHSFGLETLVEEGLLKVDQITNFLDGYLSETAAIEAAFCRAAYHLSSTSEFPIEEWFYLNSYLSALKPARETRAASATLGRRFLQHAALISQNEELRHATDSIEARRMSETLETHYATAFGLTGRVLGFDLEVTVLGFLRQSVAGLVSACQRLLPLGQTEAGRIQWALRESITECVTKSTIAIEDVTSFSPILEIASLRHPVLATRLFIS